MPPVKGVIAREIKRLLAAAHERGILWSPVGLMLGIGWYISLNNEPWAYAGAVALGISTILLALAWRSRVRFVVWPFFLVALGFAAVQLRVAMVATPLLAHELHNVQVEGTIDEIEPVEKKVKLVLSHPDIEGVSANATPRRLRVSFHGLDNTLEVGDRIRFDANLYPLPASVMPGAYDFARHFYFRSIGGNGFALHAPDAIDAVNRKGVHAWLNNLRHGIGENMRTGMQGEVGTVAAAMTVAETGPIPAEVKNNLRDSGLAHMLAIAGLHLGIVAGIVFFNVRLLMTLYPPLALRLPVKKIAAAVALFAAFIYLCLAGFPIPAERAFIMVVFLFMAVMIDRRAVTLRTLSLAATLILLCFPESLFGASFQMSFAATLAIVSLYEGAGRHLHAGGTQSWWRWAMAHMLGIIMTSLVATLATAPFVLYHFNRFALLGLIANMIVVPLATFVIMPGMVLSLLLMPVGLEAIGYVPLRLGTQMMLSMAQWVTNLPYASLHLPSPSDHGLMLAAFGLLCLCLMMGRYRFLGIPMIAMGLATIALHQPVDALISPDARQVIVRLPDGHYTALKGTARSFTIQNWLRAEGEDELMPLKETGIECDDSFCSYRQQGRTLIMLTQPRDNEALDRACALQSDILIAWRYLHHARCAGPAMLIGKTELEAHGSYALWLNPTGVQSAQTRASGKGRRIWQPEISNPQEEEE